MIFAEGVVRHLGKILALGSALFALTVAPATYAQDATSPHLDPVHGVNRIHAPWAPPGS